MDKPMRIATRRLPCMLPPEIIRGILRFLSNDRPTLLNCALVSQDWLLECRPFLFRNINLFEESADHFVSNVLRSERLQPWLTSIHHLGFMENEDFVVDISERLSNLRSMAWGCIIRRDALRPKVFAAFAKFTCLRHLRLTHCTFASFGDLKKVIVALPALSSLSLSSVAWRDSVGPDESSSALAPAVVPIRPTLSRLCISTPYRGRRKHEDDMLLWLSTTPTRSVLRELSVDLRHIGAASRMMVETSLATLDMRMRIDDNDELFGNVQFNFLHYVHVSLIRTSEGDNAQFAQLQQLFSQVRHIELLRLHFTSPWDTAARVLPLFGSVPSLHRLRFCSSWRFYPSQDSNKPEFGASAKRLDPILAPSEDSGDAFRTLRTVGFAWYVDDDEEVLQEKYTEFSAWVRRMLPQLHERCGVEVYTYNDKFVFGPTGLSQHAGQADFPHAEPGE